jgi:hypothetical protein
VLNRCYGCFATCFPEQTRLTVVAAYHNAYGVGRADVCMAQLASQLLHDVESFHCQAGPCVWCLWLTTCTAAHAVTALVVFHLLSLSMHSDLWVQS